MLHKLLNFCPYVRGLNTLLLAPIIILLTAIPRIHFAQQLQINSPLPQLKVTSPYGKRIHPIHGVTKFHYGVDLKSNSDTVKSIFNGLVINAGYNRQLGNYIVIKSGLLEIIYGHLSCHYVKTNDTVYAGKNIGISGNTGLSTAEHLHLAIKINNQYTNPIKFLKALQTHILKNSKNN